MHDVHARAVVRIGLAIALVIGAAVAIVFALLRHEGLPPGGRGMHLGDGVPLRAPGLASAPQPELAADRAKKQAQLDSAGWVDRDRAIAHIPITDAMDLLLATQGREQRP
jgi:hypothetical protein